MPLREKKTTQSPDKLGPEGATDKKDKKEDESKDKLTEAGVTSTQKKEETSYDVGGSEISDDEHRKVDSLKKKMLEKELNQEIYISISETETNILFYCPSTKYLTNKNGKNYFNFYLFKLFKLI